MKIFFRTIIVLFFALTTALNLFATTSQNQKENWVLLQGARLENKTVQKIFVVVDSDDHQLGVLVKSDKAHALYGITTSSSITAGSQFTLPLISGEPLAGQTLTLTVNTLKPRESSTFVVATINGFTSNQPTVQLQSISNAFIDPPEQKTPYEQCVEACTEFTRGIDYLYCLTGCAIR